VPWLISWSSRTRLITGVLIIFVFGNVSWWLTKPDVQALNLQSYYHYSCHTGDTRSAGATLRLLLVSTVQVGEIAEQLCDSPSVSRHYEQVVVSWKPRTQLTASDLVNETYDVIWNREHFLRGLLPDFERYYESLLHFDHYRVYWLSLYSEPVMSVDYFQGKRIGLLSDPGSHTHHVLPITSLSTNNIPDGTYSAIYFDETASLYQSFLQGDVDLITGGSSLLPTESVFQTELTDNATAATFFVRSGLQDPDIRCDLIEALELLKPLWHGIQAHHRASIPC